MATAKNPLDDAALVKELGGTPKWGGASDADVLKTAYGRYTGREADAAGLAAHLKNPGGVEGALRTIAGSPEAQGYSRAGGTGLAPPAAPAAGTAPPTSNTMPVRDPSAPTTPPAAGAPATPAGVQPSIFTGFTPKYAMEGFDTAREQNTGKSAKDAFAYLSQQAPPPPLTDKAALGQWFKQYIEPGMNQLGHKVTNVEGDKFGFENWQGKFNVDYGRGAGAEGGALAWQVDDPSAVLSNTAYTPSAGNAALGTAIAGGGGNEQTAQQKLIAEIEAMIQGGASPVENDALLQQLQG